MLEDEAEIGGDDLKVGQYSIHTVAIENIYPSKYAWLGGRVG